MRVPFIVYTVAWEVVLISVKQRHIIFCSIGELGMTKYSVFEQTMEFSCLQQVKYLIGSCHLLIKSYPSLAAGVTAYLSFITSGKSGKNLFWLNFDLSHTYRAYWSNKLAKHKYAYLYAHLNLEWIKSSLYLGGLRLKVIAQWANPGEDGKVLWYSGKSW
jgi:hypothetical protein